MNPARFLILAALGACSPHVRRDPTEAPVVVPSAFAAAGEAAAPVRWWTVFDDPALTTLLDRLLAQNLDLKQGVARIEQARLRAGQAGSSRWPSLDATFDVARSKQLNPIRFPGSEPSTEVTSWRASLAASYEIDLFGRIESLADAADAEVEAALFDQEALAMGLAATVVETWYALVEQQAQLRLLEAQAALTRTQLELLQYRFANGLSSSIDVLQQEDQLKRLASQVPLVEARIAVSRHLLATLVGVGPRDLDLQAPEVIPQLPILPQTGLPATVLGQRPDVRAAQARVAAADHRVGVAVAQRYPAIRLSASVGLQALDLEQLLDDWVWSLAGSLVAPLFDGGRRAAEVDITRAEVEARLAALGKAMLTAVREVEDALVQEDRQQAHVVELEAREALLRRMLEDAQARYLEGVTDYLPVISALSGLQQVEQALLTARRQRLSYRIQLHRALGGDWSAVAAPEKKP